MIKFLGLYCQISQKATFQSKVKSMIPSGILSCLGLALPCCLSATSPFRLFSNYTTFWGCFLNSLVRFLCQCSLDINYYRTKYKESLQHCNSVDLFLYTFFSSRHINAFPSLLLQMHPIYSLRGEEKQIFYCSGTILQSFLVNSQEVSLKEICSNISQAIFYQGKHVISQKAIYFIYFLLLYPTFLPIVTPKKFRE